MKPPRAAWILFGCLSLSAQAQQYPEKVGPPTAMAGLGDSITQALFADPTRFSNQPYHSWSTGNDGGVVSHFSQLAELGVPPAAYNLAISGARMGGLVSQVNNAVARRTPDGGTLDYVTILMGANDACRGSEETMTPAEDFRGQFSTAMESLTSGLPDARIFVASIPDLYVLWEVLHTNVTAVDSWEQAVTCQSMLANPESEATADVERRGRVRQHVQNLNQQLAEVCDGYLHCRYDQGAVFSVAFTAAEVSTLDYFHPSIAGQSQLGTVTWPATYDFTDLVAPATTAAITAAGSEDLVTFTASDDVGVRGIEYRLPGDTRWTRFAAPVSVPDGDTLVFRAVDLNGNLEASQQYRRGGPLPETDAGTSADGGVQTDGGQVPNDGGIDPTPEGGCSCNTGGLLPTAAFALLALLRIGTRRRPPR